MLIERIKHISVLLFFLFFLGLSIKFVIDGNSRLGWAGVALWGVMSVLTAYDIIRGYFKSQAKDSFLEKAKAAKAGGSKSTIQTVKAHLVTIWTMLAAILIGTASNFVTERIEGRLIPAIAVWLCSFFFTLLFYPFQKRQKDGIATFPLWAIYSAGMGVVSIVFSYLNDWLS
jgi:hypothetical protein